MTTYTVHFTPGDIAVTVPGGTMLTEAARLAGFDLNQPCGGQGRCGRCAVIVDDTRSAVRRRSTIRLDPGGRGRGLCVGVPDGGRGGRVGDGAAAGSDRAAAGHAQGRGEGRDAVRLRSAAPPVDPALLPPPRPAHAGRPDRRLGACDCGRWRPWTCPDPKPAWTFCAACPASSAARIAHPCRSHPKRASGTHGRCRGK